MSLGTPNFFSSHFNLVISFAWEKTDLISIILQFGSHGKQFGSNILTRIELSVKIKLKKFICVRHKYWVQFEACFDESGLTKSLQ